MNVDQALEKAKQIIAADLEEALQKEAARAISGHETVFPVKRTGHLVGDIRARTTDEGIEVSFPYYAQYLEYGTGIYGPKRKPIRPRTKKALAWGKDKGGGKKEFVFKEVKGMRPAPFIRPVMHQKFVDIVVNALNEVFKDVELK